MIIFWSNLSKLHWVADMYYFLPRRNFFFLKCKSSNSANYESTDREIRLDCKYETSQSIETYFFHFTRGSNKIKKTQWLQPPLPPPPPIKKPLNKNYNYFFQNCIFFWISNFLILLIFVIRITKTICFMNKLFDDLNEKSISFNGSTSKQTLKTLVYF